MTGFQMSKLSVTDVLEADKLEIGVTMPRMLALQQIHVRVTTLPQAVA
jgi:hypothetical protein